MRCAEVQTFWKSHLGELGSAVHAVLLSAVTVALCGQQVAAAPSGQGHEPLMLKHLLLSHIHAAAAPVLQQYKGCKGSAGKGQASMTNWQTKLHIMLPLVGTSTWL